MTSLGAGTARDDARDDDELLGFVRCVMPLLLARSDPASCGVLIAQYSVARIRAVRVAKSCVAVEFEVPDGAPRMGPETFATEPLRVALHEIAGDVACTLFVRRGAIDTLEADTNGPPWPARPVVLATREKNDAAAAAEKQHRGNNALAGLVSNLEYACGMLTAERDDAPLLATDDPSDRESLRLALRYSLASAKDLLALLRRRTQ